MSDNSIIYTNGTINGSHGPFFSQYVLSSGSSGYIPPELYGVTLQYYEDMGIVDDGLETIGIKEGWYYKPSDTVSYGNLNFQGPLIINVPENEGILNPCRPVFSSSFIYCHVILFVEIENSLCYNLRYTSCPSFINGNNGLRGIGFNSYSGGGVYEYYPPCYRTYLSVWGNLNFEPNRTKITYLSELKDNKSIVSPNMVDDDVEMQYKGNFIENSDNYDLSFENIGYGLKKTLYNKATIFCEDASSLFSLSKGYVSMVLNMPDNIYQGVYIPVKSTKKEYIIFGVNPCQEEFSMPGVYAAFTPNGIEFSIWSSYGKFTITDSYSNIYANTDFKIEFIWNGGTIEEEIYSNGYKATMVLRVNGENIVVGNSPIFNNEILNCKFFVLDNYFNKSNMECTIRNLEIGNGIPYILEEEWYSSSSSSSSEDL